MKRFTSIFIFLVLAGLIGGAVFLAAWNIPAPSAPIEVIVPDERFAN